MIPARVAGLGGGVLGLVKSATRALPLRPTSSTPEDSGKPEPARPRRTVELTVRSVTALTNDSVAISFSVPRGLELTYAPGQHLTLHLPVTGGTIQRCYSLCSGPDDEWLTIGVKRTDRGPGSNWLVDHAKPGLVVNSSRPTGVFTPHSLDHDLTLIAAGSGITPVLSIAKWALARGTGAVFMVYANQNRDSVMFAAEIEALATGHQGRLHVLQRLDDEHGRPGPGALADLLREHVLDTEILVCGPPAFLEVVDEAMIELDVVPGTVKRERFDFDVPDRAAVGSLPGTLVDGEPATAHLAVRGEPQTLTWPRGTLLLDTMIEHDIDVPYVCRSGYCGGCVFTLTSGEVMMLANSTLDDADLAAGRRLACQSLPVTDDVGATFHD